MALRMIPGEHRFNLHGEACGVGGVGGDALAPCGGE
jgi:hypothetical protein